MAMNLLLALAISLATIAPQSTSAERESLAGFSSMDVVIEGLGDEALATGLSTDQLKTDVELKLRLAGIKVKVTSEQLPSFLYVRITYLRGLTTQGRPLGFDCMVEVQFKQFATLLLNNKLMMVPTWYVGSLINGPEDTAQSRIRQLVRDKVDQFINDYLSVNPKP
jgi:hypothetical protein